MYARYLTILIAALLVGGCGKHPALNSGGNAPTSSAGTDSTGTDPSQTATQAGNQNSGGSTSGGSSGSTTGGSGSSSGSGSTGSGSTMAVFHIPSGTGGNHPWNGVGSVNNGAVIKGVVGGKVQIFNDDTVAHQVHTSGVPFSHMPQAIQPGASVVETFTGAYTSPATGNGQTYDHLYGPNEQVRFDVR